MSKKTLMPLLLLTALIVGCSDSPSASTGAPAVPAAQMAPPLKVTGVISAMGSTGPQTVMLQAEATTLTTDAEIAQLKGILANKGQTEAVNTMYAWSDTNQKGWVRIGPSLGYPIAVIRSKTLANGGRQLAFVSSRPISFAGAYAGVASTNYPIGIVMFTVGADGKGEGKIYGAIQATVKDGEFDLSSYSGGQPQLVTNVLLTSGK
ncbi:MAG TPA: hypothetical protein VL084_00565 [Thermoanaerobaculia bacterium]|nr:hypothetical protein [Thermoanaerobaculia bacterium]